MSHSPSNTDTSEQPSPKRRKTMFNDVGYGHLQNMDGEHSSPMMAHLPKRGARACTACRRGKNRCEGEPPCRRCQLSGTPCVFEKPDKKPQLPSQQSLERVGRLENQFMVMQSQIIGIQSSLDKILNAVQPPAATKPPPEQSQSKFPPLPGFAPPPHKYATYGIVPSTAASSDDESEDTLPRSSINAPIEALQGLANAAAEAASASTDVKSLKKRKVEPIPRNAFPHVVEKGLVTEAEGRELHSIFFSGCHLFIPVFDPVYDSYDNLSARTPWCFDAVLAVAGKVRNGSGPPSATFYKCLEEAQGIARSSLFGPVVRKEAVQAMLILAAWSTSGWLPSGHAMRMALDLSLHRALEKLAENGNKARTDEEARDLVVSARIWLCLYWLDHQMSLGTGRPIVLRDETSTRHCRLLLTHRFASPTDVRLIALVELIAQKTHIHETLSPMEGAPNHNTLAFVRRASVALDKWWEDSDALHRQAMEDNGLLREILRSELYYSKLWLICVALRGTSWDKMPFDQRELAFQAKDAASSCLSMFLGSQSYRAALRYAVHDSLVMAAFSGLFLLKMANLFPADLDLAAIMEQVEEAAQLLSEVAAERYALTLRLMLANLRRKMGLPTGIPKAAVGNQVQTSPGGTPLSQHPHYAPDPSVPFTNEELGVKWSHTNQNEITPSTMPAWLQDESFNDLGLPVNGLDAIFFPGPVSGWPTEIEWVPEAW